jgi:hypothetical protein
MQFRPIVHDGVEGRIEITFDKNSPILRDLLRLIVISAGKCLVKKDGFAIPCVYMSHCRSGSETGRQRGCKVAEELRELREQIREKNLE